MSSDFEFNILYLQQIVVMPKVIVRRIIRVAESADRDRMTRLGFKRKLDTLLTVRSVSQNRLLAILQVQIAGDLSGHFSLAHKQPFPKNSDQLLLGREDEPLMDIHALKDLARYDSHRLFSVPSGALQVDQPLKVVLVIHGIVGLALVCFNALAFPAGDFQDDVAFNLIRDIDLLP